MSYYYDNEQDCIERRIDSDLAYCDQAINLDNRGGFRIEDVAYVLAEITGENDGPDWHWIIAMKDHTYAYVTGGCDYTGWGCQDWGEAKLFVSLKEALGTIEDEKMLKLRSQLVGLTPFGAQ